MMQLRRRWKATMMMVSSAACLALVILFPGWREELRAQVYTFFIGTPQLTIDICEVDNVGVVRIGGRFGPDGASGEPVFVSRGNQSQNVATVFGNGTFEGATSPGFAQPGQTVTVGVRGSRSPSDEGNVMATCQLASSVSRGR